MNFDDLEPDERRYLAMHARYRSNDEVDFRYQHKDPVERERLRTRWREIADALYLEPWKEEQ